MSSEGIPSSENQNPEKKWPCPLSEFDLIAPEIHHAMGFAGVRSIKFQMIKQQTDPGIENPAVEIIVENTLPQVMIYGIHAQLDALGISRKCYTCNVEAFPKLPDQEVLIHSAEEACIVLSEQVERAENNVCIIAFAEPTPAIEKELQEIVENLSSPGFSYKDGELQITKASLHTNWTAVAIILESVIAHSLMIRNTGTKIICQSVPRKTSIGDDATAFI